MKVYVYFYLQTGLVELEFFDSKTVEIWTSTILTICGTSLTRRPTEKHLSVMIYLHTCKYTLLSDTDSIIVKDDTALHQIKNVYNIICKKNKTIGTYIL